MFRNTGKFLVLAAVLIAAMVGAVALSINTLSASAGQEIIHEDDPRWDCRIHGNQICGPQP